MSFALTPKTRAGEQTVAAAAKLIPQLWARGDEADRSNSVCRANFDDLIQSGVASAFVPTDLGGFGLQSVHDWIVTIATLARGDASTAIAINMQLGVTRGMALAYSAAKARGKPTDALAAPLQRIVTGEMLICATATEAGTDNLHPLTEAVRAGDGWSISGRKFFVTLSPIATHLGMNLRMRDDDGDHLVTTMLPMNSPGLQPQDDWDALGMRSSGSQSVVFDNVKVPLHSIRKLGPWGQWSLGVLMNRAIANLPLVAAFLGIGEAAHNLALEKLQTQTRVGQLSSHNPGVAQMVGEMEIELAQCRAILVAAANSMDDFLSAQQSGVNAANTANAEATLAAAHELMKDYQAAKWVVNRGAIDIVSKAMDLLGGAGYTNHHPLARLYRDVRAGPFMQPFAPTEARG